MGLLYNAWAGFWLKAGPAGLPSTTLWPPSTRYSAARDVPELAGKVIIVTGGASGIGYSTAKTLLLKNAKVYIAGRNPTKVAAAIAALERETGKAAVALHLDLEDLDSVKGAAEEFLSKEDQLHVLFCNAGLMNPPTGRVTKQGYDLQFGTNVVGHYLFTLLLLSALKHATAVTGVKARVVHTSSALYLMAPKAGIDWDSVQAGPARDAWVAKRGVGSVPTLLYSQSKLANIMAANLLHRAHAPELVSVSVHPGLIRSELGRHSPAWQDRLMNGLRWPTEMGAVNLLFAGMSVEGGQQGGKYVIPWAREGVLDKRATDHAAQDKLGAWLDGELRAWL